MKRVLIVEDNKKHMEALQTLLSDIEDIQIIKAYNMTEACYMLSLYDFSLFIVDIVLDTEKANDVSGINLVKHIRDIERYEFTPVIFITSLEDPQLYTYRDLHCYQYIEKPFDKEKTQKIILEKVFQQDQEFEERMRSKTNFASILGTVYHSAVTDVEEDKVPLYANALINAINDESLENAKVHIFLNFLRDFSILHIEVLRYFSSRHAETYSIQQHMNSFHIRSQEDVMLDIIRKGNPSIAQDKYLLNTVMNDLHTKGLLKFSSLSDLHRLGLSINQTITTQLGDEFLEFIKDNSENK